MRSFFLISICFISSVFISPGHLMAQTSLGDSSFYEEAISNAIGVFRKTERDQSRLYNGRQYKPYTFTFIRGVPFFLTEEFTGGTIHYDGSFYDSVRLLYDEIKEMVIIDLGWRVELVNERIGNFSIGDHQFLHLKKDSLNNLPASGFYEKLYNGQVVLYKKEKKEIKDHLSVSDGYQAEAIAKSYYYIKLDNIYHYVKRKKNLLNIFKDKKNEIQQYMKSSQLNFKNDKERTLSSVAAYYDQITK